MLLTSLYFDGLYFLDFLGGGYNSVTAKAVFQSQNVASVSGVKAGAVQNDFDGARVLPVFTENLIWQ